MLSFFLILNVELSISNREFNFLFEKRCTVFEIDSFFSRMKIEN